MHRRGPAREDTLGLMGNKPRIEFLAAWRKHRKLSQEALAGLVRLTQGMISQLENGDSDFTGNHLALLSRALRCSWYDLLYRDPKDENDPIAAAIDVSKENRPLAARLLRQLSH